MNSIILRMILPEVLALLQLFVKSPKSLANEATILVQVRDSINQILEQINTPTA